MGRHYFGAGDPRPARACQVTSARVAGLRDELSRVRRDLAESGAEQGRLSARVRELTALCESLGRDLARRDAEIARLRAEWIPRRVHEACLRIDGAKVREYAS